MRDRSPKVSTPTKAFGPYNTYSSWKKTCKKECLALLEICTCKCQNNKPYRQNRIRLHMLSVPARSIGLHNEVPQVSRTLTLNLTVRAQYKIRQRARLTFNWLQIWTLINIQRTPDFNTLYLFIPLHPLID